MNSTIRAQGEKVRHFILEGIAAWSDVVNATMKKFGISRQAVNKHIQRLKASGAISVEGTTRSPVYTLCEITTKEFVYPLRPGLAEDIVWSQDIKPAIGPLPDNVLKIWSHAFTEIFNNAIDHSGASRILVRVTRTALNTAIEVHDDGVGIFLKIQRELDLLDERQAIFELTKGKLTTDSANHSGEGVFFTSRMMDQFSILSGKLFFTHRQTHEHDWLIEDAQPSGDTMGTSVRMILDNHTARTTKKIFDEFSGGDDYAFNKTIIPLNLAQFGPDELTSRSQAKRVLARVHLFSIVIFDFKGVEQIGQAFADQIFRVYANEHPGMEILPINMRPLVKNMVMRAQAARQ